MTLPPLLTAQTLLSLPAGRFRYLDASILLPKQDGDPEAAFHALALPEAIRFRIKDISETMDPLPHMAPGVAAFARFMTGLGLSRETGLVFYDQSGSVGACRAHWMACLFGHENVHVLDGGLASLTQAQVALQDIPRSAPPAAEPYLARATYALLAGKGDVLDALAHPSSSRVLDARNAARFYARDPEPRPGMRSGHMPGAVNLPFSNVLTAEGCFLAPDVLRARFMDCDVVGRHVITSCGSGLTAATLTMALRLAGLPPGQLYDGSWAEWGSDPTLPVESG